MTSTNQNCCLPNCIQVSTNCKEHVIDTNCYINYDPFIGNIRKIYKSYEDKSRNVRYKYEVGETLDYCHKPRLAPACTVLPEFYRDYKILLAGYSTYGGCPKKSSLKYYDVERLNNMFAENYVVEQVPGDPNDPNPNVRGPKKIICEDTTPFRVCQPSNIPAGSRFRLFVVFAYRYEICDTVYCENKPWKFDLYVADLPSVNCLSADSCKVPNLQLQLVSSLDTDNMFSVGSEPTCVLCSYNNTNTNDDLGGQNGGVNNETSDDELIKLVLPLVSKYAL